MKEKITYFRYVYRGLFLAVLCSPIFIWGQATSKNSTYSHQDAAIRYMHLNELDSALQELNKASKVAENKDDIKGLLTTYLKFAIVHLELGDLNTALFYRDRASIALRGVEYPFGEAFLNYLNARILLEDNKPYQALELLKEAQALSNEKNLRNNIQLIEADILTSLARYSEAEMNYNALVINSDELERSFLAAKANLSLAKMNEKLGNFEKSAKNGEAALEISKNKGYHYLTNQANRFLTLLYEKMGRFDLALNYQRQLSNLKDSIFTLEKIKATAKTAEKITNEQKDTTIAQLQDQNAELLESENRAEFTAILSLAFLTIISLLAVSLFRNNQIKVKTNDLLHGKNVELEKARDDAILAMKAKSNFLSTVTHELRTPLYAVTGLTHILLEENPSEHQKEHLKSLKFSGEYLLNFINDILQVNKIDADKVEVQHTEFKLKKVLSEVMDSLQQSANDKSTKLVLEYDELIPLHLMGDPMKLSQIFMNLVGNALKFTKKGTVTVIASLLETYDDRAKVHFQVKDNGIGISEEQQKNIFDSFEQGSIQINREYGGTGLGLTIVKSLLGLFGSKITLESKLGEGSTFLFDIDFTFNEPVVSEVEFQLDSEEINFKGLHLLIVEDNKINQVITKKMLLKKEMTCDIANNGIEAVDKVRENHYDCVLMDIHMPGMGGTEATQEIRKFNKDVPIIALTAISMEDSVEEFIEAGCNDVVTKPFKPEIFYQKIGESVFRPKVQNQV